MISPIGNMTYINQNTQASATQHANATFRPDMNDIISKEFEDKLNDIQETRPSEESALNPDSKGNSQNFEENTEKNKKETSKDNNLVQVSSHLLDIKV